jgi:hypothetical protein
MSDQTLTQTAKDAALQHLYKIQAALTGADSLLTGIEVDDDRTGELWSAKELVKLALDHAMEMYPSIDEVKVVTA